MDLGTDLQYSNIANNTSRIICNVDADTSPVVVQVRRAVTERIGNSASASWMKADQNWVSLNGADPVRFDCVSNDNTEACSPELHLKKGVNVISLFIRSDSPTMKKFTKNASGLNIGDSYNYRGYQNFIYLITYKGDDNTDSSPSSNAFLSSMGVTQYTAVNNNPAQVLYPSTVTKEGYEHSFALPESMTSMDLTDTRYVYGTTPAGIIHEDIVLNLKTEDPYARSEVVDGRITAPGNKDIYDGKLKTTSASISMIDGTYGGQYTAVNVWNKNEIQVKVIAPDGSEKIHTIKIVRASSAANVTELTVNGGSLGLENLKEAAFSAGTHEYYLDISQETVSKQALSFTLGVSSGASISVDNENKTPD